MYITRLHQTTLHCTRLHCTAQHFTSKLWQQTKVLCMLLLQFCFHIALCNIFQFPRFMMSSLSRVNKRVTSLANIVQGWVTSIEESQKHLVVSSDHLFTTELYHGESSAIKWTGGSISEGFPHPVTNSAGLYWAHWTVNSVQLTL